VSALIVVLAVMTGFQDGIKDRLIAANPHILVLDPGGRGVSGAAEVASRVRAIRGVLSATPFVVQQALFTGPGRGATGGLLRGVDLDSPAVRKQLAAEVKTGSLDPLLRASGEPAVLLGRELARTLGVVPGDHVTVISPQSAMTGVGLVPKMRRFEVAGYVEVGLYEYDASLAYTGIAAAQEFAGLGDRVSGVEVKLNDPFDAKEVGRRIAAAAGQGLWIRDWMGMNRNLFAALQLEKLAMGLILLLIVIVAAFNIVSTLTMVVTDKTREIGILRAMGLPAASVRRVFVLQGAFIGLVGTTLGTGLGLLVARLVDRRQLIALDPSVYFIDHLPVRVDPADLALIVVASVVVATIATVYPARQAAGLAPVEAIRYE